MLTLVGLGRPKENDTTGAGVGAASNAVGALLREGENVCWGWLLALKDVNASC